jgi:hypothetical protein
MNDGDVVAGNINTVVRIGGTVRRPVHRWTMAVHSLLRHLKKKGFDRVPRVGGIDDEGREILSYLPGEAAYRPWPEVLLQGDGLVQVGVFLKLYHQAVADYVPPYQSEWCVPGLVWRPGQIVLHGDLGPWNTLWEDNSLSGVIDWDFAEPGEALADVAQWAWRAVPLRPEAVWRKAGFVAVPDFRGRLAALCTAYGVTPVEVVDAVLRLQAEEVRRTRVLGAQGIEPWAYFNREGFAEEIQAEKEWLEVRRGDLI